MPDHLGYRSLSFGSQRLLRCTFISRPFRRPRISLSRPGCTPTRQSGSNVLLSRQGRAFLHLARFLFISLFPLLAPASIISSSPLSTNLLCFSYSFTCCFLVCLASRDVRSVFSFLLASSNLKEWRFARSSFVSFREISRGFVKIRDNVLYVYFVAEKRRKLLHSCLPVSPTWKLISTRTFHPSSSNCSYSEENNLYAYFLLISFMSLFPILDTPKFLFCFQFVS